ncbi:MAG: hypothetical protein JO019_01600 [Candidatus Kaiserbacteria bacterium]|nr:hypothetical protein [Candidatus Kaiserbacteria bacterium]
MTDAPTAQSAAPPKFPLPREGWGLPIDVPNLEALFRKLEEIGPEEFAAAFETFGAYVPPTEESPMIEGTQFEAAHYFAVASGTEFMLLIPKRNATGAYEERVTLYARLCEEADEDEKPDFETEGRIFVDSLLALLQ